MDLEEALSLEFETIPQIQGKVFPLFTGEGIDPPFLIYIPSEGTPERTLNEFTGMKVVECQIHVVGGSYEEMKTILKEVMTKIISFRGRVIGASGGPFIHTLRYEQPEEMFEGETWIYRASFEMTIRI